MAAGRHRRRVELAARQNHLDAFVFGQGDGGHRRRGDRGNGDVPRQRTRDLQGGSAGVEHHDLTVLHPSRSQLRQMGFHLIGFTDPGEIVLARVLGTRQRPAVYPLHQADTGQFRQIPADGVFGHREMLAQLRGHDLAVSFEDQQDFLPAYGWKLGSGMVVVHVFARLCVKLRSSARLAKARDKHKRAARQTPPSIIFFDLSNHYAEFFILL
ncbi:hypothetical protein D9M71_247540 [compost metagenome]